MDGDTLNSISLKFDTTPAQLARFNKRTLAGFSMFTGDVREGVTEWKKGRGEEGEGGGKKGREGKKGGRKGISP